MKKMLSKWKFVLFWSALLPMFRQAVSKAQCIEDDSVVAGTVAGQFVVSSTVTSGRTYIVDVQRGFCECYVGASGACCKHQLAAADKAGVVLPNIPIVSTPQQKAALCFLALGPNGLGASFFGTMKAGQHRNVKLINSWISVWRTELKDSYEWYKSTQSMLVCWMRLVASSFVRCRCIIPASWLYTHCILIRFGLGIFTPKKPRYRYWNRYQIGIGFGIGIGTKSVLIRYRNRYEIGSQSIWFLCFLPISHKRSVWGKFWLEKSSPDPPVSKKLHCYEKNILKYLK